MKLWHLSNRFKSTSKQRETEKDLPMSPDTIQKYVAKSASNSATDVGE